MKQLTIERQQIILSEHNSKPNKLHLCAGWLADGYYIEWRWESRPLFSRLQFRFAPTDKFISAKSFEEDIHNKMKFLHE